MAIARAPVIVAIPVKNEAARIGDCLAALASQEDGLPDAVVLLLNDCVDATAGVIRGLAPALPFAVHVSEHRLPPHLANAGHARHLAMEIAARHTDDGILLTTDADSRVMPNWVGANLRAIGRGADAVAGVAVIDAVEARLISPVLHADDARERAYGALLDQIAHRLDPLPWDPLPRHTEHSGASIAVTRAAYVRAGGMPPVAIGEDRAFFDALRRIDAQIRHAPEVRAVVSGRLIGRAVGGMADTIRRRHEQQDDFLDDQLEPARDAARRYRLRAALRVAWRHARTSEPPPLGTMERACGLPEGMLAAQIGQEFFGTLWARIEAESEILRKLRMARTALDGESARARAILNAETLPRPAFSGWDRMNATSPVRDYPDILRMVPQISSGTMPEG
jgi:glycosyltransferase involved in cell wall biosynthesis